jgi:hypothetical protein
MRNTKGGLDSRRCLATALGLSTCAVTLGHVDHRTSRTPEDANPGIKFADCMRSHGVQHFPDPALAGGIQIPDNSGINPRSPAFLSAQNACSKLLPGAQGQERRPQRAKSVGC